MTSFAQRERAAICDTFLQCGPDAPTLDDPWRARDLAAHLAIRDSRPDLSAGQVVPVLRGRLDRAIEDLGQTDYPALVERVRQGPPAWSPARIQRVDDAVNGSEFFIHHEDLLRAQPGFQRRSLDVAQERFLWEVLVKGSRLILRRAPTGVVLVAEGYGRHAGKKPTDAGTVVLRGRPGELVLYTAGRARVAQVQLDGPPEAVGEIEQARFGF